MKQIYMFLALAIGIFMPLLLPSLPSFFVLFSCCVLFLIFIELSLRVFLRFNYLGFPRSIPNLFLLGFAYGMFYATSFQSSILPKELNNIDLILHGYIEGIPEKGSTGWNSEVWKFDFIPQSIDLDIEEHGTISPEILFNESQNKYLPKKVRLSYYGNDLDIGERREAQFISGEILSLKVKLKQPHGLSNPSLFDYKLWLISKGYSATGYVKEILETEHTLKTRICLIFCFIDQKRSKIADKIIHSDISYTGIQAALIVGDSRFVSNELSQLFVDTGTIHLMVISGLHVGLMAGIGFFLCRWMLTCIFYKQAINVMRWASLAAILSAFIYSVIAGFSMPTLRAVVMVTALMLPRVFLIKTNPWWGLCLALMVIGVIDPMAPLDKGFWLSFGAVILIFLSLRESPKKDLIEWTQKAAFVETTPKFISQMMKGFISLCKIQLFFLIGFSPLILWFQGQVNPANFFANLVAVSLTSLVIIPLEFVGLISLSVFPDIGVFFWKLAGFFIGLEIQFLEFIHRTFAYWMIYGSAPWWLHFISVLAGFSVIGFRSVKKKGLAFLFIIPAFLPIQWINHNYLLEVKFFDVGQGTAVLVRQPSYSLLYDTGPRYSSQFDSGADILAPSLKKQGIRVLDDLVLSHPDSDHVGGFVGLSKSILFNRIWFGKNFDELNVYKQKHIAYECSDLISWQVGQVEYSFLYPNFLKENESIERSVSDNDRSCVLSIEFGDSENRQRILLPGDITASVEREIIVNIDSSITTSALLAPHHGSKTSSSKDFVEHLSPTRVVYSAGYLNRFGHPHKDVVDRYLSVNSETYATYEEGMIQLLWNDLNQEPVIKTELDKHLFWWQK